MKGLDFYKYNKIFGLFAGLVSFIVYSLTVEPTASYWDCAEYISTSAKLQIGHPPGAPLFQMLGAIFSIFALESTQIAYAVNMMSVFSSSLTIIFLFWSILILSVLFWLGLKWADDFENDRSNKWLILISFVVGLSFGVHFMGLLAIPSIGLIYYFRKYKNFKLKSFLMANILSVGILLFIFKLLLPSTLSLFGNLEVFFVNDLGLPFNSGTIFSAVFIICSIYYGLLYTAKKRYYLANTTLLSLTFIFIGFSSWLMIPIRSNANTVINENSPKDARSLLAYYNLEQYPDTYLFYGPMFSDIYAGQDPDDPYKNDKPKYERDYEINKYIIVNDWEKGKINSNKSHEGLFPRMWSSDNAVNYLNYYGFLDFEIKSEYKDESQIIELVNSFKGRIANDDVDADDYHEFLSNFGSYLDIDKPSLFSNISYFINFQLSKMYFRYFMWNFSGRQNDKQWKYDLENGNWISGINIIDEYRLGPQKNLPLDVINNKARNQYYLIPFIRYSGPYFYYLFLRE